jgi:hypothetical protein
MVSRLAFCHARLQPCVALFMAEFARWAHRNPTTTAWRSTAVDGGLRRSMTSKSRLDSVYGALWRLTVGFRTDLKIMVSPVRISRFKRASFPT